MLKLLLKENFFSSFIILIVFNGVLVTADVKIISREGWNALPPTGELTDLNLPIKRVIIIHTASTNCSDQNSCSQQLLNIQSFQQKKAHFDDIAYNFLIGGDGNVYEGRGWNKWGSYARNFNVDSIGIAFIGNFMEELPTSSALQAAKTLIGFGVETGKLQNNYILLGHRQVSGTMSPGEVLYNEIKQWPHWSSKTSI